MRLSFSIVVALLVLCGCRVQSDTEGQPCKVDAFFCKSAEDRLAELRLLSDKRLATITTINYKFFTPPFHGYAEEIGRRGNRGEAIAMMLAHQPAPYAYDMLADIAQALREESDIDICRSRNSRTSALALNRACDSVSKTIP